MSIATLAKHEAQAPTPQAQPVEPTVLATGCRSYGEQSSVALASRVALQVLEVLTSRISLDRIRHALSIPVAGVLARMISSRTLSRDIRLRSVHACLTNSARIEACAVIAGAARTRSLLMRIDRTNGASKCTLLTVL